MYNITSVQANYPGLHTLVSQANLANAKANCSQCIEYQAPGVDTNVTVMTSTFLSMSYAPVPCIIYHFFAARRGEQMRYWQPLPGNADVRVRFKVRKHELNVSSFSLVILPLSHDDLGEGEFVAYEEKKTRMAIPDGGLLRAQSSSPQVSNGTGR
jgi:hypothetical protein